MNVFKKFPPLKIGHVISSCRATASTTSHHGWCLSEYSLQGYSCVTWCFSRSYFLSFSSVNQEAEGSLSLGPSVRSWSLAAGVHGSWALEVAWLLWVGLRVLASATISLADSWKVLHSGVHGSQVHWSESSWGSGGSSLAQYRQTPGTICMFLWCQCRREPETLLLGSVATWGVSYHRTLGRRQVDGLNPNGQRPL